MGRATKRSVPDSWLVGEEEHRSGDLVHPCPWTGGKFLGKEYLFIYFGIPRHWFRHSFDWYVNTDNHDFTLTYGYFFSFLFSFSFFWFSSSLPPSHSPLHLSCYQSTLLFLVFAENNFFFARPRHVPITKDLSSDPEWRKRMSARSQRSNGWKPKILLAYNMDPIRELTSQVSIWAKGDQSWTEGRRAFLLPVGLLNRTGWMHWQSRRHLYQNVRLFEFTS